MYFIIGFAVIGLASLLIKNPSSFLITIFTTIIMAFIIFMIVNAFLGRRMGGGGANDEMKKYRQAVKQSKQKYKPNDRSPQKTKNMPGKLRRKRRRPSHLRVIEGKKSDSDKNNDDLASN